MKEFLVRLLNFLGFAYWVEIVTDAPSCTYYFGPFISKKEAGVAKAGYIEDLQAEGAQKIQVNIKRCKPNILTVCDERVRVPVFS
jgi:hypothetical protein